MANTEIATEIATEIGTVNTTTLVAEYLKKIFIDKARDFKYIDLSPFMKDDLLVGKGIKNIAFNFLKAKDFKDIDMSRIPTDITEPQDLSELITDEWRLFFTETINKDKYLKSMNTEAELTEFIANLSQKFLDSVFLNSQTSIEYLLGKEDTYEILTTEQKEVLDKSKTLLGANEVTAEDAGTLGLFKEIKKQSLAMSKLNKLAMNKKDVTAVAQANQILFISEQDALDLQYAKSTIYNPNAYNIEGFYKVYQLNIPKGTAYIIDKEAIRLYPRINEVSQEQFPRVRLTDFYLHYWVTFGTLSSLAAVKITGK